MNEHRQAAFEAFLVEDVILTLANLRASLAWFGEDGDGASAGDGAESGAAGRMDGAMWRRAGLARIDRQIGMLEDRARSVCRSLGRSEPQDAACDAPAPSATPGENPSAEAGAPRSAEAGATLSPALPVPPSIAEAIRVALGTAAAWGDADRNDADRGDPQPDQPRDSFGAPGPAPDPDQARQGAEADGPAPPADTAGDFAPQGAADSGPGITAPAPWLGDLQDGGEGRVEDWLQDAAQDSAGVAAQDAAEIGAPDAAPDAVEGGPAPVFRSRRAG